MNSNHSKDIRNVPILSDISGSSRRSLTAVSEVRKFPARTLVFSEGVPAKHLHILLEGSVDLFGAVRGREATINVLRPGNAFILAAVVRSALTLMSARTMQASRILFIPADAFRSALREDPALAINVSLELGLNFRSMVKLLRDQKLRSSRERLAAYILRLARENIDKDSFKLPTTKRVLASLLGIEPASLSRTLASLGEAGIRIEGDIVHVEDIGALAEVANSDWVVDDPWS